MINFEGFWAPANWPAGVRHKVRPGVDQEVVQTWERKHGVRLPELLRLALARQNGGYVFDSQLQILPLQEIRTPDDDFWDYADYKRREIPKRKLLLEFARDEEQNCGFYLNYNTAGAQNEPSVFGMSFEDDGELCQHAKSLTDFFEKLLKSDDLPLFDWSETGELDEVLAEEAFDLSDAYQAPATHDQVLGRKEGKLVYYQRQRMPDGERLTKMLLSEPIFAEGAMIMPVGSKPFGRFVLTLLTHPDSTGQEWESVRTTSGRWKNRQGEQSPFNFMSADRARLEALRRTLIGAEAAASAEAREQHMHRMQNALDSGTPAEQDAARLNTFLNFANLPQQNLPTGSPLQGLWELAAKVREGKVDAPPDAILEQIRGTLFRAKEQVVAKSANLAVQQAQLCAVRSMQLAREGKYAEALDTLGDAIKLDPTYADAYNNAAWYLATCPDDKLRDGAQAVAYARKACELSGWQTPHHLGTLAAACAEAGQFDEAINWQEKALEFPEYAQHHGVDARMRLALYRKGKPYRSDR
jgi:tetratricopeptide (TPR) repeat protein